MTCVVPDWEKPIPTTHRWEKIEGGSISSDWRDWLQDSSWTDGYASWPFCLNVPGTRQEVVGTWRCRRCRLWRRQWYNVMYRGKPGETELLYWLSESNNDHTPVQVTVNPESCVETMMRLVLL
jgi:hypothetical protein